ALRSGLSRIVGMVSGDLTNEYWAHFASCAMRCLRERGYQLLLAVRDAEATPAPPDFLVDRGADGIIVPGAALPAGYVSPCPLVAHDIGAGSGDAVNPDVAPALEQALTRVDGRLAALLPENSVWSELFPACARRCATEAELVPVPLDPAQRPAGLRQVCRSAPGWILCSGWQTFTQLRDILRDEFPKYHPRIIVHANCRGSFLAAPEVDCAIVSSTAELVRECCSLLLERIGDPAAAPRRIGIPCRCVGSDSAEFGALCAGRFALT
ncbi:MAG: LacI family DNA-binding transcriptional regulator, partial [Lentisphaeria bacterium]|nr:LacI family DNA-binding transcriptional regulator [Lentisphaeria bacterium]